jgi:hypothetical protein
MDFTDYYSAGYYLIRAGHPDWPQWENHPLLPYKVISLSECIAQRLAIYWGWNNRDSYRDDTLKFGIPESKLNDFYQWCESSPIDYPGIFPDVTTAQKFIKDCELPHEDLYLLGLGLHKDIEKNWEAERSEYLDKDGKPYDGVPQWIFSHRSLEAGATVLGYELLGLFHYQFSHSWLCSGLEIDVHQNFGIKPNQFGLISNYEDAKKLYDLMRAGKLIGEPEPYDAWLLLSYPLNV